MRTASSASGRSASAWRRACWQRYRARPPQAWLTYHAYHKSPDWLGPPVADALGIPYLIAEASFAPRQADGPWALGHAASARAIRRADVVLVMTARDAECLAPLIEAPAELRPLPPFLDPLPYQAARAARARHRAELMRRFGLDPDDPWLLAVAMMRQDVKLTVLSPARRGARPARRRALAAAGGRRRPGARRRFEPLLEQAAPGRVRFAGAVPEDALPAFYAAADLMVWPAVREAYGLAMLEAQAAGLPVVAGREGGVAEVVQDGVTGILTAPRDPAAFAAAIRRLLLQPEQRRALGSAAARFVARERSLAQAAATLRAALAAAPAIRAARR